MSSILIPIYPNETQILTKLLFLWAELAKSSKEISCLLVLIEFSLGLW